MRRSHPIQQHKLFDFYFVHIHYGSYGRWRKIKTTKFLAFVIDESRIMVQNPKSCGLHMHHANQFN